MIERYSQTDRQLHQLSQVIAKANRTYVPAQSDDSHTNLSFDPWGHRLMGRWMPTEQGAWLLTFHLDTQVFDLYNAAFEVAGTVATVGRTLTEVEAEIEALLPQLGLDPEGFTADLHFEIPAYDLADQPIAPLDPQGLQPWQAFRTLANEASLHLLSHAQAQAEIRIWPHHFDTGIYFKAKPDLGVGFGLAMEDEMAGSPYFYLAAYPAQTTIRYQNLPASDFWHWETGEHWNGAILTLQQLAAYSSAEQKDRLATYLKTALHWMMAQ